MLSSLVASSGDVARNGIFPVTLADMERLLVQPENSKGQREDYFPAPTVRMCVCECVRTRLVIPGSILRRRGSLALPPSRPGADSGSPTVHPGVPVPTRPLAAPRGHDCPVAGCRDLGRGCMRIA